MLTIISQKKGDLPTIPKFLLLPTCYNSKAKVFSENSGKPSAESLKV